MEKYCEVKLYLYLFLIFINYDLIRFFRYIDFSNLNNPRVGERSHFGRTVAEIRHGCQFISSLVRALAKFPGGIGRFLPCRIG